MSIRDLFLDKDKNYKILSEEPAQLRTDGESIGNIRATFQNRERFIPRVDFSKPSNFARYGSAEKYYESSISRIYGEYPYDGSSKEKQEFLNESTYIDLWLLENKYPRTNGYVYLGKTADYGVHHDASGLYFPSTDTDEYIHMVGGPHTASDGMAGKPLQSTFDKSNVYDTDVYADVGFTGAGTREGNLKCDPSNGMTVEFWLKKPVWAPIGAAPNVTEAIFDLSGSNYGRFAVSLSSASAGISIEGLYQAESVANSYSQLISGPSATSAIATVSSWNHYAVSYANSGSSANWNLYINGKLVDKETDPNQPVEITGSIQANIGALTSRYPGAVAGTPTVLGDGKLTGSLDEFRFWKVARSAQDIGRYWRTQVYGGTNTDIANTTLGVYYKFNEGIVGSASIDSSVLDYSGRTTNGNWVGYTSTARSTQSAMVEAGVINSEFKDPIIYSENPLVINVETELKASGSQHDINNGTSFYNLFPNWIIEEDEAGSGDLRNLTQIMSSYLDTLQLQIQELPQIKDIQYFSGSYSKELPFMSEILEGAGFVAPEIFANASVLNQIFKRSETENYEKTLTEVKNLIYRNIYNNLLHIYKSKGTEKAFRNLIRCYGVDDSLIKLNLYSNNLTYELENTYESTTEKRRYTDFYKPTNFTASVYQQTSSLAPNSINYIATSSAGSEKYTSFTLETDIILPRKRRENEEGYFQQSFFTSSIMGFHTARAATPSDLMWATSDHDLRIYAMRPPENNNLQDAYFVLTSSYYGIELKTETFKDAYDNKKWQLAARFRPQKTGVPVVSGSTDTNYWLEFYGIQSDLDVIRREFSLSASIQNPGFITEPKRIYAGSHRQDFTGSILDRTDVRLGGLRYWMSYLNDSVIQAHARDPFAAGTLNPNEGTYLFEVSGTQIPQADTRVLDWGFAAVSSSNALGQFLIYDMSSGSAANSSRYGWFSEISEKQHTGKGDFYPASSTIVNAEFVPIARKKDPESLNPSLTSIKITSTADQEAFTRTKRPAEYYYALEKSMYATISEEMLRYFATIIDFNNLIGEPVNRYRMRYKPLEKLRNLFFENIENTPDLDKYIEYYKWIDDSLSTMLMQLIPASSNFSDGIRTVIESHVLERNKYKNKFPLLEIAQDDPSALMSLANTTPFAVNTPTLPESPPPTNEHCYWWKNRVNRTNYRITSGDPDVDNSRNYVLSASVSALKHKRPLQFSMKREDVYGPGLNDTNNKITNYIKASIKFDSTDGMQVLESQVKNFVDCKDDLEPLAKKRWSYEAQNQVVNEEYTTGEGNLFTPFVAVSSSVTTGYNQTLNSLFRESFSLENMHTDAYVDGEVPLQGPFTEKFVGGNQHRHIALNQGTDTALTRPEAWNIQFSAAPTALKVVYQPVNHPRATFYRDLVAKRSVNIANIKRNDATGEIGNYSQDYEIVQTCGRHINNIAYVHSGGFDIVDIPSPYVAGMDDYAKPQRGRTPYVFVNRFSSPGSPDTAGDSNGGPALDPESAEYSPYNNLNYRNTSVRWINDLLLSSHVNQFGFYSDDFNLGYGPSQVNSLNYQGTASIYQVNRNPISQLKYSGSSTITASVYDNYWVQHPIPRTDRQYAWITASIMSYDTFGYLPYDGEGSLVTFSSASDFISYKRTGFLNHGPIFGKDKKALSSAGGGFAYDELEAWPTAYVWFNLNTLNPIQYKSGHVGYPSQAILSTYGNDELTTWLGTTESTASILNALLLQRNGPYQAPTWKQIRKHENPVVRKWNRSGITAYNLSPGTPLMGTNGISALRRFSPIKVLKDPPVISKYKPLRLGLKTAIEVDNGEYPAYMTVESTKLKNTYGNNLGQFANEEITKDIRPDGISDRDSSYRALLGLYANGALDEDESPVREFEFLEYSEQIYPAAINSYMKRNRERVGYTNTFWKNNRLERTILGASKNGGRNSQDIDRFQSAWAVDGPQEFGEPSGSVAYSGLSSFIAWNYATGSSGELQNDYTFYWRYSNTLDPIGNPTYIKPAPILSRKQEVVSWFSVVTPSGMKSIVDDSTSSTYLSAYEDTASTWPIGHVLDRGGNAKFETDILAGKVVDGVFVSASATPFYDKYEQYNLNMRLLNKDMSVIPEFRISTQVRKYLNDSNGFESNNSASFEIVGVNQDNTETLIVADLDGNVSTPAIQVSDVTPQNSSEDEFYRIYSFSDFMRYVDVIADDHDSLEAPRSLTLSCNALMKFIPYDGFYPAERTLNIAHAFSSSYGTYISCSGNPAGAAVTDNLRSRPVYESLFSPGILFNTIKSGVAVDYPIYTGSFDLVTFRSGTTASPTALPFVKPMLGTGSLGSSGFDHRVTFESLLHPDQLNGIGMVDMNATDLIAIDITSSLQNAPAGDTPYKLMINNFLGEIPNFFLDDLTTARSQKDDQFVVEPGTTYAMRVKMFRTMNTDRFSPYDFPIPNDYILQEGLHETITMYSRPSAFGPPLAGSDCIHLTDRRLSEHVTCDSNWGLNPSYTPPYYNGECWADIFYESGHTSGSVSVDQILASSSVNYLRVYPAGTAWPAVSPIDLIGAFPMEAAKVNNFAMQLSASLNLLRKDEDSRWVIQTKFETPILNFGDTTARPLSFNNISLPSTASGDAAAWITGYGGQTTTPIGMWHQFGLVPEENQGIYLQIEDINPNFLRDSELHPYASQRNAKSLADVVGFSKTPRKLGQLRDSKTVYEAIVAIPFVQEGESEKVFFELTDDSGDLESLRKNMDKYVFPPQFDFVRNNLVKPLATYVFEFEYTFDRDDLSHMWQNVSPPSFASSFKEASATVSHPLLAGQMMESITGNIQWMVFKVKQRAEMDYYNNIIGGPKTIPRKFGYNWPYDYFSMVEFAKIDSTIRYGHETPTTLETLPTASSTLIPNPLQKDISLISTNSASELKSIRESSAARIESAKQIKKREPKK